MKMADKSVKMKYGAYRQPKAQRVVLSPVEQNLIVLDSESLSAVRSADGPVDRQPSSSEVECEFYLVRASSLTIVKNDNA